MFMDLRHFRRCALVTIAALLSAIFILQDLLPSIPHNAPEQWSHSLAQRLCPLEPTSSRGSLYQSDAAAHDNQKVLDKPKMRNGTLSSHPSEVIEIPKVIWQITSSEGMRKYMNETQTWPKLNPGYRHHILTDDVYTELILAYSRHRPSIAQFWNSLTSSELKADSFLYLHMLTRGGIYTDIASSSIVPIAEWVPKQYGNKVMAVVGIEHDNTTDSRFIRPIGFTASTLMATAGHQILERAVARIMSNLEFLARQKGVGVSDLILDETERLHATGAGMLTDVVMGVIRDTGVNIDWNNFHELEEPVLYGDVLVLPVNAFCGYQKHSHSGEPAYGERFVHHDLDQSR